MEILIAFAYILGIILVLLAGILIEKDDYFGFYPLFGGGLLLLISIFLGSKIGETSDYEEGYKQGNIDGYNCIYKYHLETQSDSSIIWVENKK